MFTLRFTGRLDRSWRAFGWLILPWCCASCAGHRVPPLAPPNPNPPPSAASSRLSMTATVGGPQTGAVPGQALAPRPALRTTPLAVAERRVGWVRMIGAGRRFVLIEATPSAQLNLADGQELRCRTSPEAGGAQTALVRVGRERRQQFIVADVLDGLPHAGDSVYLAARSSAGSASSTPALIARPRASEDHAPTEIPMGNGMRSLFDVDLNQ